MFGNAGKDPLRGVKLVKAVRSSNLNLNGVTQEFLQSYDQINFKLTKTLADKSSDAYYLAFKRFSEFCDLNNVSSLPSHPEVIMTYFIKISSDLKSISSVFMACSAIRFYNLKHRPDLISPTDHPDVVDLVRSLKREYSKPVKKMKGFTKPLIKQMIDFVLKDDHLKVDNFNVDVNKWMIVISIVIKFYCFARFEEVVELVRSNFIELQNGDIYINFVKAKNNQFHDAKQSTIAKSSLVNDRYCPVNLINVYFRRINLYTKDYYILPRIAFDTVYLFEKACYNKCLKDMRIILKDMGVVDYMCYGEHSGKIGGISTAANAGCSAEDIQFQGRYASDRMPKIYQKRSLENKRKVTAILNEI